MESAGERKISTTLDYSGLTSLVTADDRKRFLLTPKDPNMPARAPLSGKQKLIITLLIGSAPLAIITLKSFMSGATLPVYISNLKVAAILTVCLAFVACVIRIVMIKSLERTIRLKRFAAANNLSYDYNLPPPNYRGMIFDEGHSRKLEEQLVFPDSSEISNYTYVTGRGRNSTTHTYGYVRIKFQRKLPHMVLDAKSNNLIFSSGLPTYLGREQILSLEGDFDKYYTLYVPRGYERDALYLFTPDVMAALIDSGAKYDIEVVDNEIYLYSKDSFDLGSETFLEEIISIINCISDVLKTQVARYRDEKIDDYERNVVSEEAARLKNGTNLYMVGGLTAFVVYIVTAVFWVDTLLKLLLAIWAPAAILLVSIGASVVRNRLR